MPAGHDAGRACNFYRICEPKAAPAGPYGRSAEEKRRSGFSLPFICLAYPAKIALEVVAHGWTSTLPNPRSFALARPAPALRPSPVRGPCATLVLRTALVPVHALGLRFVSSCARRVRSTCLPRSSCAHPRPAPRVCARHVPSVRAPRIELALADALLLSCPAKPTRRRRFARIPGGPASLRGLRGIRPRA